MRRMGSGSAGATATSGLPLALALALFLGCGCTLNRSGLHRAAVKDLVAPPVSCPAGYSVVYCGSQGSCAPAGTENSACVSREP